MLHIYVHKNKHPKVDFQKYLDYINEPDDLFEHDTKTIPSFEGRIDPHTMRDEFRRKAQEIRGAH